MRSLAVEVVAGGLAFPEGPFADGDDSIVLVAVAGGTVHRVELGSGTVELVADVGGGPNGAHPTTDGGVVVAQNGGFDFGDRVSWFPPCRPVPPGLQLIEPDGRVRSLWTDGALAPNDLVAGNDGTLWLTDPGPAPPVPGRRVGRILTFDAEGQRVVASGLEFCNGVEIAPDGRVVFVEAQGIQAMTPGHAPTWIVERVGPMGADGFAVDRDGRFYVAAGREHVVRVLDCDGTVLDVIDLPGDGFTTNCCFGGADLTTLFVTDGIPGRLLAVEGMPPGLRPVPWPVPTGMRTLTAIEGHT